MIKAQTKIDAKLSDWENLNVDTYKLILEQGEKRLLYLQSEAESITDKCIKMLTVTITFLGLFIGVISKQEVIVENFIKILFAVCIPVATLIFIGILITPKKTRGTGFEPSNLLEEKFDNVAVKDYLQLKLYYLLVIKLQDNIDFMMVSQKERACKYRITTWLFILTLIGIPLIAINIIYHS